MTASFAQDGSLFGVSWNSRSLTAPGPQPQPVWFRVSEISLERDGARYVLLPTEAGPDGMTLGASGLDATVKLRAKASLPMPFAIASSVGGTDFHNDHWDCGPANALDGNLATAWRAREGQWRDAWIELHFPIPAEVDELEVVAEDPEVIRDWKLYGAEREGGGWKELGKGSELPRHVRLAAKGTWSVLRLQLADNTSAPAISELMPLLGGESVMPTAPDRVELVAEVSDGKGEVVLVGGTDIADAILCRTAGERGLDRHVLTMTSGYAAVSGLTSLYDRERDIVLSFDAYGDGPRMVGGEAGYRIESRAPSGQRLLSVQAHPYYFQSQLGVRFYRPIDKSQWSVPPTFGMTWYGIRAWESETSQNHERLDPQIEWVAKHLKPYGLSVFQLDDCYARRDDAHMRSLSEKIHAEGMLSGIWFTPFSTAFPEQFREHPDWFIHDKDGTRIRSFTGHTYRDPALPWDGPALNMSVPGAVEWYRDWWKKANDTWDYDYFKIDGIPTAITAYFKAADIGRDQFPDPMLAIQRGIEIGREVVGATKFINLCWGMPIDAMGRTGVDSGGFKHNIMTVIQWQYLNNTAWWCDPDSLSYMHDKTEEHTRLRAQARTLSGQQFSTDETWTLFPAKITRVLQKSIPMIDIRPTQLYRIVPNWEDYDLFDVKFARPWGQWDVVGLFNYYDEEKNQRIELSRLSLAAGEYHVWSFWDGEYLGKHDARARLNLRKAKALEGRAFAVVRADAPVQLLATDRHTTMGGLDLAEYKSDGGNVSGRSTHLVAGDPYRVIFHAPGREVKALSCEGGTITAEYPLRQPEIVELVIVPAGAETRWSATFAGTDRVRPSVAPAELDFGEIAAGAVAEATLTTKEAPGAKATSSDPWLKVKAGQGGVFHVTADANMLSPGTEVEATLVVETPGALVGKLEVPVRAKVGITIPAGREYDALSDVHDEMMISHDQGWGNLFKDRNIIDKPITLRGKVYAKGLGTHAPQRTEYFIGGRGYTHFAAMVGMDDSAKGSTGKVRVRVLVDGKERYVSPELLPDSAPLQVVIEIRDARTLTLVADSEGDRDYDHVDWADARLYR